MITDGPTEEEAGIVSEHFTYLERLTEAGVVLLAGRTLNEDYSTFGIIIFRRLASTANQIVADDPAVKHRVIVPSFTLTASPCWGIDLDQLD